MTRADSRAGHHPKLISQPDPQLLVGLKRRGDVSAGRPAHQSAGDILVREAARRRSVRGRPSRRRRVARSRAPDRHARRIPAPGVAAPLPPVVAAPPNGPRTPAGTPPRAPRRPPWRNQKPASPRPRQVRPLLAGRPPPRARGRWPHPPTARALPHVGPAIRRLRAHAAAWRAARPARPWVALAVPRATAGRSARRGSRSGHDCK